MIIKILIYIYINILELNSGNVFVWYNKQKEQFGNNWLNHNN